MTIIQGRCLSQATTHTPDNLSRHHLCYLLLIAGIIATHTAYADNAIPAADSALSLPEKSSLFIDDKLSFTAAVDSRVRTRRRNNGESWGRLNYASYNLIADYQSGYYQDWIGFNLAGYIAGDIFNNSQKNARGESLTNEVSMSSTMDWGAGDRHFKITNASLKFHLSDNIDAKIGFLQADCKGVIGNVWAFVPGTYRGVEISADYSPLKLSYFATNQHTASWIHDEDDYAAALWSDTDWSWMHSLGLDYALSDALSVQLGIGQSYDVRYANDIDWNNEVVNSYHQPIDTTGYSLRAQYQVSKDTTLKYIYYGVRDTVQYEGMGHVHGLFFDTDLDYGHWMTNIQYNKSDNDRDVNPRMIYTFGMNNGLFSMWWDALSDWNKSGEIAIYNRFSAPIANGWEYYLGFGYGTGSKSAADGALGDWDYGEEFAINATLSYTVPTGQLKDSTFRLHATRLKRNEFASATRYADETDLRFTVVIPYHL